MVAESEKNKGGRPNLYNYDDLKKYLLKYSTEHVGGTITVAKLVKYSNIPRHAWRYSKQIQQDIYELNKQPIIINNIKVETLNFPSAEDLVNQNYNDKKRLIKIVNDLLELYQYAFDKARSSEENLKKCDELNYENNELRKRITQLSATVEFYKEEIKRMSIDSMSSKERKEKNIKENVISVIKISEIESTFKSLFDE
jgi:hypothetical protein